MINAGVGGYTSWETLMNLQFRVLELNPDLVIVYQGNNDVHAHFVYPYGDYQGDNSGYRAAFVQNTALAQVWEHSTILRIIGIQSGWTTSQSAIEWNFSNPSPSSHHLELEQQMYGGRYPSGIFSEIHGYDMLQANPPVFFEQNLRSMVAMANANDVDVFLVTFVAFMNSNWYKATSREYRFGRDQHNATRIAEEMGTYFYDLAAVFPQKEDHFADGIHMTRKGNTKRAIALGQYIIENIFEAETSE